MRLKNILTTLLVLVALVVPTQLNSQVEEIESTCKSNFEYPFIVTGKPFRALLTGDEITEFKATLFSSTTYRIAVASKEPNMVIFSIYDMERNLLFTNEDFDNAPYWDFVVDGYLDCLIEAKLDNSVATSGFAIVLTGLKLNE